MKRTLRQRPPIVITDVQSDGTHVQRAGSWEGTLGKLPVGMQTATEYVSISNRLFNDERDRAGALLAPAFLDTQLELLLQKALVPGKSCDQLTGKDDYRAPLGSLGARIHAAHAFGLIANEVWTDLLIIRDIRNAFAHQIDANSFNYDPIKKEVSKLKTISDLEIDWDALGSEHRARMKFQIAVMGLVHYIARAIDKCVGSGPRTAPVMD